MKSVHVRTEQSTERTCSVSLNNSTLTRLSDIRLGSIIADHLVSRFINCPHPGAFKCCCYCVGDDLWAEGDWWSLHSSAVWFHEVKCMWLCDHLGFLKTNTGDMFLLLFCFWPYCSSSTYYYYYSRSSSESGYEHRYRQHRHGIRSQHGK